MAKSVVRIGRRGLVSERVTLSYGIDQLGEAVSDILLCTHERGATGQVSMLVDFVSPIGDELKWIVDGSPAATRVQRADDHSRARKHFGRLSGAFPFVMLMLWCWRRKMEVPMLDEAEQALGRCRNRHSLTCHKLACERWIEARRRVSLLKVVASCMRKIESAFAGVV
jgi:hypothetical protein